MIYSRLYIVVLMLIKYKKIRWDFFFMMYLNVAISDWWCLAEKITRK